MTNKGVAELLKKWGEGASLIRGTWHARATDEKMEEDEKSEEEKEKDDHDEGDDLKISIDTSIKGNPPVDSPSDDVPSEGKPLSTGADPLQRADPDALASAMSSLSLVPPSIRFGRGGSRQGFLSGHRGRAASKEIRAKSGHTDEGSEDMDIERSPTVGRGRGRRQGSGQGPFQPLNRNKEQDLVTKTNLES